MFWLTRDMTLRPGRQAAGNRIHNNKVMSNPSNVEAIALFPGLRRLTAYFCSPIRSVYEHYRKSSHVVRQFYAGDKATYVKALARSKAIFIPDGRMPANGPAHVLKVLTKTEKALQGKTIDLGSTYTLDFVSAAR